MAVACLVHQLYGTGKGCIGDAAGIGSTGEEMHGKVGIGQSPVFRRIAVEHQTEEILIAVGREVEHAQRVGMVGFQRLAV